MLNLISLLLPHPVYAQGAGGDSIPSLSDYIDNLMPTSFNQDLTNPAGLINALLPTVFIVAGLILFGMLIAGGFQMLTAAGNPKAADAGKARRDFGYAQHAGAK